MERLNRFVGRTIPWLTLGMVLVTFAIVILRYFFGRGWVWMQEIVLYMHALTFLLAAGYTLSRDAHVRVDIIYRPLNTRRRALVNLFGSLLLLIPCSLVLCYHSLPFVFNSWAVFEGSKDGGGLEAVFLLKTAIPLCFILLLIQAGSIIQQSTKILKAS